MALQRALRCLLLLGLLAGCTDSTPRSTPTSDAVVVASFNFAESELVAEIYAQALENAGVPVRRELDLGPRELVLPALRQGLVDVVPEYLGTALSTVSPSSPPATDPVAARIRLADALRPDGLQVLRPAAAQNTNGLAVTRDTAARLALRTTSDLRLHAPSLTIAGPAECPQRPYCLPGLTRRYGLHFGTFVAYPTEAQRITALEEGVVDIAVVFTTDGVLADRQLVLLADDQHLQPSEQLLPVVSERVVRRYGAQVTGTLDAISARLDSAGLTFLNWRVTVAGNSIRQEAHGWLQRHGLLVRRRPSPHGAPA